MRQAKRSGGKAAGAARASCGTAALERRGAAAGKHPRSLAPRHRGCCDPPGPVSQGGGIAHSGGGRCAELSLPGR